MSRRIGIPFDSIENAHEYIRLLAEAVAEAKRDIDDQINLATHQMSERRVEALRVVEYNLGRLQRHLSASSRTLSDLRSLRRILHGERTTANGMNHHQVARAAPLTTTTSPSEPPRVGED